MSTSSGNQQNPSAAGAGVGDDQDFSMMTSKEANTGADEKFMGQKERRKSSAVKMFLGDYLSLATNQNILKVLAKNGTSFINESDEQMTNCNQPIGDTNIVFSDIIIKINKRNKMQERILLITDLALYNIEPSSYKVKRRISLKELGTISLSKLPDNFFCLHVPSEYDYLLVSNKKTEIVSKICEVYEKQLGEKLAVNFNNSFDYKIDTDVYREILFTNVEGGISTQIFTKKKSGGGSSSKK
ncbi:hypothetical protein MP638_000312 [Amoeboaphelidium occidentale]|nr:hypothetical protein MP638_000312 [Amoeboaphelidium occidentale]